MTRVIGTVARSNAAPDPWPRWATLGPFPALPAASRLARLFTVMVLNGWNLGPLSNDAELIVGELAANAVGAAFAPDGRPRLDARGMPPELRLCLLGNSSQVQLEVWDSVPERFGLPVIRRTRPEDESGRGLPMVRALSSSWGWEVRSSEEAKRVWALLEVQDPARS